MIGNLNDWESIKEVQAMCGRLDFVHIYAQRKMTFYIKDNQIE